MFIISVVLLTLKDDFPLKRQLKIVLLLQWNNRTIKSKNKIEQYVKKKQLITNLESSISYYKAKF